MKGDLVVEIPFEPPPPHDRGSRCQTRNEPLSIARLDFLASPGRPGQLSDLLTRLNDAGDRADNRCHCDASHWSARRPSAGQAVELRAAVVFGRAPLRSHFAAHLEPVQRRVQRAFFDAQDVVGRGFDEPGDAVAVGRAAVERVRESTCRACPQSDRGRRDGVRRLP